MSEGTRRPRVLGALLVAATSAACATAKGPLPQWPLAPEQPRIRFVRTLMTERDLEQGFFQSVKGALLGASEFTLEQPSGLALSVDEKTLFVVSAGTGKVLAVDLGRGTIRRIADGGNDRAMSPFTAAVDADDNVYITDMAANAVLVYSRGGKFLRRFEKDTLQRPTGIAIDRRRQVAYVVSGVTQESQSHRIEVFSLQGKHLRTIGTRGHGPGEFNFPNHLCVGPDGTLYVVDMLNFRVQLIDPDGQVVGMFGRLGAGQPGTLNKAKGIALDSHGNIYVADSEEGFVQLFNRKFQVLMAFGGRVPQPGYLSLPTALAIDSRNNIYVADFHRGGVHQYRLLEVAEPPPQVAPTPTSGTKPATSGTSDKGPGGK